MSARQKYRIAQERQKTIRQGQNLKAQTIKSVGSALSNSIVSATTPFATQKTVQSVAEERTARERAKANSNQSIVNAKAALDKWMETIGGNPDKEAGEEGSAGGQSTSKFGG